MTTARPSADLTRSEDCAGLILSFFLVSTNITG
jgi:hypothetical protein